MICPKCNRKVSENKKTCLYCGEPLAPQTMSNKTYTASSGTVFYVQDEKVDATDLSDLPDHIRANVKDAFRIGQKEVTLDEESRVVEYPSDGTLDIEAGLPIKKALSIISGIKDTYRRKQIEPAEYEKLVLGVIQDYVANLDNRQKIQFAVSGILDSEFTSYLNDGILQKLRNAVIESASQKP